MRAMVMAAGRGERMRPLTLVRAKPVLPVLGRPLLHWTLEHLARQGVTDVVINVHHLPATVRRTAGGGEAFGLRIRYSREEEILGTGGGVRRVRRFFGAGPALIVNGDVLFDFDLRRLMREHVRSGARVTLALLPNPDPRRYSSVVIDRAGWVRSIAGRPEPARGRSWLFTGIQVVDPAVLGRLPPGPSESVRDLYIPLLASEGGVRGVPVDGAWYDFGSPALYLRSHMSLLRSGFRRLRPCRRRIDPAADVAPTATVVRSVIGARCVVGPRARVVDSVLWEDVRLGPSARIERSILAAGTRIPAGARRLGSVLVTTGSGTVETKLRG